jgi:hypothetical protein
VYIIFSIKGAKVMKTSEVGDSMSGVPWGASRVSLLDRVKSWVQQRGTYEDIADTETRRLRSFSVQVGQRDIGALSRSLVFFDMHHCPAGEEARHAVSQSKAGLMQMVCATSRFMHLAQLSRRIMADPKSAPLASRGLRLAYASTMRTRLG